MVALVDRDLGPHVPVGMGAGLSRASPPPSRCRLAVRNGPPEAVRISFSTRSGPVEHLEDGVVLGIDRQKSRSALPRLVRAAACPRRPCFPCWPARCSRPAAQPPGSAARPAIPTMAATTTSAWRAPASAMAASPAAASIARPRQRALQLGIAGLVGNHRDLRPRRSAPLPPAQRRYGSQ